MRKGTLLAGLLLLVVVLALAQYGVVGDKREGFQSQALFQWMMNAPDNGKSGTVHTVFKVLYYLSVFVALLPVMALGASLGSTTSNLPAWYVITFVIGLFIFLLSLLLFKVGAV